jgi:transcriptional regulator with XRE-family HTH domain
MTGEEIKAWRLRLGLSQPKAAQVLDVAPNTIARWEQGSRNVGRFTEVAIRAKMAAYDEQQRR